MFLSQKNRNLIQQTIFENILPNHLKNKNLINKKMEEFYQPSDARPIIEINKSFLLSYVKNTQSYSAISQLQEIKSNDFDNELKKHQQNFEEIITLKKPSPVQFEENITNSILDETTMEQEVRIKMEQRQKEMDMILSQQTPIVIKKEITSVREIKNEKPIPNVNYEPKRVTFKEEPEPEVEPNKLEIVLLELNMIKQELVEIKKMILLTQSQ
jgi:hypothetical protein